MSLNCVLLLFWALVELARLWALAELPRSGSRLKPADVVTRLTLNNRSLGSIVALNAIKLAKLGFVTELGLQAACNRPNCSC